MGAFLNASGYLEENVKNTNFIKFLRVFVCFILI